MHYDALTAAAVADEWRRWLVGGRVDKIFQPDAWSIALLVRSRNQNFQVFQSFNPRFARAHLVRERKLASGFDEPTPFVMLLRKHLESARILAIHQPAMERILRVETAHGGAPPRTLIIELVGRQSNAVLVDEQGVILGALRHVTADMSRSRTILPHRTYQAPPPAVGAGAEGPTRLDPRFVTAEALGEALAAADGAVAEALPRLLAISPTAAAEAVFRVAGDAQALRIDPASLAAALRELFAPLTAPMPWQPSVARRSGQVIAFAPYRLRRPEAQATVADIESVNLAVEQYFAPRETAERQSAAKSRLLGLTRPVLERALRRLAAIEQQRAEAERNLALRRQGELLLAYQPELAPEQREVALDDFETGAPVRIPVDWRLSATQNAQRIFKQYARAKRAIEALESQQAELAIEIAFARQVVIDVELCETPAEVARLEAELRAGGFFAERQRASGGKSRDRRAPRKGERNPAAEATPSSLRIRDFDVLYGKTSQINDALTFGIAARQDTWLHAKGVPGSHVVIRSGGRSVPEAVLTRAAGLAAYLSGARAESRAAVDFTTVANVRRQPGGKPGLVYYVGERTIQAPPLAPTDAAKEDAGATGA